MPQFAELDAGWHVGISIWVDAILTEGGTELLKLIEAPPLLTNIAPTRGGTAVVLPSADCVPPAAVQIRLLLIHVELQPELSIGTLETGADETGFWEEYGFIPTGQDVDGTDEMMVGFVRKFVPTCRLLEWFHVGVKAGTTKASSKCERLASCNGKPPRCLELNANSGAALGTGAELLPETTGCS